MQRWLLCICLVLALVVLPPGQLSAQSGCNVRLSRWIPGPGGETFSWTLAGADYIYITYPTSARIYESAAEGALSYPLPTAPAMLSIGGAFGLSVSQLHTFQIVVSGGNIDPSVTYVEVCQHAAPTPTPRPTNTPTRTPTPTSTHTPTSVPTVTPRPPTATLVPTATPRPATATSSPTARPTNTPTNMPTATVRPSSTPTDTPTTTPTATTLPTNTPAPAPSPAPAYTCAYEQHTLAPGETSFVPRGRSFGTPLDYAVLSSVSGAGFLRMHLGSPGGPVVGDLALGGKMFASAGVFTGYASSWVAELVGGAAGVRTAFQLQLCYYPPTPVPTATPTATPTPTMVPACSTFLIGQDSIPREPTADPTGADPQSEVRTQAADGSVNVLVKSGVDGVLWLSGGKVEIRQGASVLANLSNLNTSYTPGYGRIGQVLTIAIAISGQTATVRWCAYQHAATPPPAATSTPTRTATPTVTPTRTATATPTVTPTVTPSATPSQMPTLTPIGTATPDTSMPGAIGPPPACVPAPPLPGATVGPLPDLGLELPTFRPLPAVTVVVSLTAVVAPIQTIQAGVQTPQAALAGVTQHYSWSAGQAQAASWSTHLVPVLAWFAILNPSTPAWQFEGGPLWAIWPMIWPMLPMLGVTILVAVAAFVLWFSDRILKIIDLAIKLIELIPGE